MGKKSSHRSRSSSKTSVDRVGECRKRRRSSHSSSSSSRSKSPVSKKQSKTVEKKRNSKKRSSSTSSSLSSSSRSNESSSRKSKKRKHKKSESHKHKKQKRKLKKKLKKEKRRMRKEAAKVAATAAIASPAVKKTEAAPTMIDPDEELTTKAKAMAPMTKEEWEKRQSVIKRVFDEESGRHRLVKGDGEVLEEIVSRDRHREINKQATKGDGAFFQAKLATNLRR